MNCRTYLAPLTTMSGLLDPFTVEELYFYVYVRYESRLTGVRILLSLFPPITPIRAPALATKKTCHLKEMPLLARRLAISKG